MNGLEIGNAISGLRREGDCGTQGDGSEFAGAIGVLNHGPFGSVGLFGDYDSRIGAEMQHP